MDTYKYKLAESYEIFWTEIDIAIGNIKNMIKNYSQIHLRLYLPRGRKQKSSNKLNEKTLWYEPNALQLLTRVKLCRYHYQL